MRNHGSRVRRAPHSLEPREYCPTCRTHFNAALGCACSNESDLHFAVAAFTPRRILQRECPACGHVQSISSSKLDKAVTCERCDSRIAPRRRAA